MFTPISFIFLQFDAIHYLHNEAQLVEEEQQSEKLDKNGHQLYILTKYVSANIGEMELHNADVSTLCIMLLSG